MALNEGNFGISLLELKELMSRRRGDAVSMINERGGLDEIARQLKTDLQRGISTLISSKDLNRQSHFGVNRLPHDQRKSLARIVCESCLFTVQDKLLVMFIITAIISMILGLAIEPRKVYILSKSMSLKLCSRGVPRGVLRVLEHPHQKKKSSCSIGLTITALELLAREVTHTATDLQLTSNSYKHSSLVS